MNENITFKSGEFGYVDYKSTNPFEFYHILNELEKVRSKICKAGYFFLKKQKNLILAWSVFIIVVAGGLLSMK